jgi:hypothetical protein
MKDNDFKARSRRFRIISLKARHRTNTDEVLLKFGDALTISDPRSMVSAKFFELKGEPKLVGTDDGYPPRSGPNIGTPGSAMDYSDLSNYCLSPFLC